MQTMNKLRIESVRVRLHIIRNEIMENVGKSQSCMVSKLRIICSKQTVRRCQSRMPVNEINTLSSSSVRLQLSPFVSLPLLPPLLLFLVLLAASFNRSGARGGAQCRGRVVVVCHHNTRSLLHRIDSDAPYSQDRSTITIGQRNR